MFDEASCKHHEMTPHFAFHPRILRVGAYLGAHAGRCRAGCTSPSKDTTAMIVVPPLLCESGLVERKRWSQRERFSRTATLAQPQPPR